MSLETWKSEHYAVPADKVPKNLAIKHSLLKWRGLRLQVLRNHGLQGRPVLREGDDGLVGFHINSSSCALCHHHLFEGYGHGHPCNICPLFLIRGKSCDTQYSEYITYGDPEPMIALLEEALKRKESGNGASDCLPR